MTHTYKKPLFKRSTLTACILAATALQAQAQEKANGAEAHISEEIIVYGIKQSLQDAQSIKRDAATVQDVITASDIGALPDKSVVEALQRVPGVTIERFEASDDPDHFSVEGGNVTVRGLNRVRAEINGRDGFSASGDGGLNFSDIPPEMVGSVIVQKNQEASMIEGGIAGTINLVTRKPFDKEGLVLMGTVEAGYGDLIDDISPRVSSVISNTWDTDAGKFGALLSVSSSNLTTRGDGVGIYNYKRNPGTNNFAPLAASARQQENDRDRLGIAASLQWANPAETVQTTLEFIRSDSTLTWSEHFLEYATEPWASDADQKNFKSTDATYDCSGSSETIPCMFTSGTIAGGVGNAGESYRDFRGNPFYVAGARKRTDERVVNDLSFNVEFTPSDNLKITADAQYIDASNDIYDMTIHNKINSTDAFIDVRNSDNPKFELINNTNGTNLNEGKSYFMRSAMDHQSANEGDEFALQLDGEYSFDEGLIKAVKTGVRVSKRTLDFKESLYNWGSLGETWMGNLKTGDTLLDSGLVEAFTFNDHLNGSALQGNNTFLFPSDSALSNAEAFYDLAMANGVTMNGQTWKPLSARKGVIEGTPFRPGEIAKAEEDRSSFYIQMDFGNEDATLPFSGNVGLRYVSWQLTSTGADLFGAADEIFSGETDNFLNSPSWTIYGRDPTQAFFADYYKEESAEQIDARVISHYAAKEATKAEVKKFLDQKDGKVYTVKGDKFNRLLPSLNLRFAITDEFIARFGFSQSMFLPTLNDVKNSRLVTPDLSIKYFKGADGKNTSRIESVSPAGYAANGAGNPLLQPELSTNYDLTFEWYYNDFGSLTSSLFYKDIEDYFRQSSSILQLTNAAGVTQPVTATFTQNAGVATVQGLELALQSSLEIIHESLEYFGVQASYTYIDGSSDDYGDVRYGGDPNNKYSARYNFNNIRDLPLEGLSQDNYNLVAFYNNETFEARLAYSWRSSYLLNSRDVIAYAPVFGEATGQLDASVSWKFNDNFKVGLQANNLLNEITRTSILNEVNPGAAVQETVKSPRSYFANDRRVALFLQAQF
ncbi:MAG: TonB-dependent receptor [Marinagarivorans sp.]|nr:TonB-dependent receptor [Marinagarivorans sp.]